MEATAQVQMALKLSEVRSYRRRPLGRMAIYQKGKTSEGASLRRRGGKERNRKFKMPN